MIQEIKINIPLTLVACHAIQFQNNRMITSSSLTLANENKGIKMVYGAVCRIIKVFSYRDNACIVGFLHLGIGKSPGFGIED